MQLITTRQQGPTLIESMVALLVISVGLLGIAALQITSMKQNATALNHSQAVWISYNMADRIRANTDDEFMWYGLIDTNESYSQDCMSGPCNPEEMTTADAADWKNEILTLPSGRGIIEADADGNLVISVMWDDEGTGATGTDCGPDPEVDLACFQITLAR